MTWVNHNHDMKFVECWVCGCLFGMPNALHLEAQSHESFSFHCPNGHKLGLGEGSIDKLKKQLEESEITLSRVRGSWKKASEENERLLKRLDKKKKT